jgi:hypothetical protein
LIDHPFLDFKDLSDEELLDKTTELHKKLNKAHMWGSSSGIADQLMWMLEMIEEEKMERQKKANFDAMNAMFPETIESDPDFGREKPDADDTNSKVIKPSSTRKTTDLPMPMFDKEYTKDKDGK